MATADDIRAGLKTNITGTFSSLTVYDRWRGQVTPPCVVMDYPRPVTYLGGDSWRWDVRLQLQLPLSVVDEADRTMAGYLDTSGAGSMITAVLSDKTLGGTVTSVNVPGVEDVSTADNGESPLLVATWTVEVFA